MKILFVGDSPTTDTGFARCTRAVCQELYMRGHEAVVLGINFYGDPHNYPYTIYPCRHPYDGGLDAFGVSRLPYIYVKEKPDAIVLLNDPWNIPAYLKEMDDYWRDDIPRVPIIGWLAVDGKNQAHSNRLNKLDHVVVWTEFAGRELVYGGYGGGYEIVPLGVDHDVYYPRDKAAARRIACPLSEPDDFIIGVVGRNQLRKRLDLTIAIFNDFIRRFNVQNAKLYLHCAPTGDNGVNIPALVNHYNLGGKVLLSAPRADHGETEDTMAWIYNAFDVYLTTTQGEGWGLPCLEAMACGVPCVVPDWSALGSQHGWISPETALQVPCTSTAMTAPINTAAYTIGGVIDQQLAAWTLNVLHKNPGIRAVHSEKGLDCSALYSWDRTGKLFCDILSRVVDNMPPRIKKDGAVLTA